MIRRIEEEEVIVRAAALVVVVCDVGVDELPPCPRRGDADLIIRQ